MLCALLLLPLTLLAHPLAPPLAAALERYRALATDPAVLAAWRAPLPPLGARKLEPGVAWHGLTELAARLTLLGDLAPGAPVPKRYEGELVAAVKRFQARHGLLADGVLGPATLAQLAVTPEQRARQLERNLERLQRLPAAPRHLLVNVPEFTLRAYAGATEVLSMRVIVGNALKTRTSLFIADMRSIEFSPYWNVPASIARQELVPKLRADPLHFETQGFEFVDRTGHVHTTLSEARLEAVLRGEMRLRQRPGPRNALGGIKFIFPNDDAIYLHHTPAVRLFERSRRDFSHGCIRVERPVELALFVLADLPGWDAERVQAAMAAARPQSVRLPAPLPVVIAYLTARADEDGQVFFFPDLYGLDTLK